MASFMFQILYCKGKNHSTHRTEGWVGPRDGVVLVEYRKILPCWELNRSNNFTLVILCGQEEFSTNYGCLILNHFRQVLL
jgi:hypothetical protein